MNSLASINGLAFISLFKVTTAYPAFHSPTKLLPSVNNCRSGFSNGVSFRSGQLEYTCSITCKQSCSCSDPSFLSPCEISKPGYSTVVCTTWAVFCDTLYPASPKKFNRLNVALLHSCTEVVLTNISSTLPVF